MPVQNQMPPPRTDIIGISATRASAILGFNQWKTPLLAWQEIMEKIEPGFNAGRGYTIPEREDKAVFRWGTAFEDAIIDLAEVMSGRRIGDRELLVADGISPTHFSFIDGAYPDGAIHEGKTTNFRAFDQKWGDPGSDRIPQEYQVQVQHAMMCAGAEEAIVSVLVFPRPVDDWEAEGWRVFQSASIYGLINEETGFLSKVSDWAKTLNQMGYFHQYHIAANPKVHKSLRAMYVDFWERYVLTKTEPDITDYEDIRRLFTAPKGTLVVPADVSEWMREYKNINAEIGKGGHLSKRKDELKTRILEFARLKTTVADDESQEKIIFMDEVGRKIGQFDGSTFRA